MRVLGLAVITLTGLSLSGCSQISNLWKKSDASNATVTSELLRPTPQQAYDFQDDRYDVDVYDASSEYSTYQSASYQSPGSQYAGYAVELYSAQPSYVAAYSDPREAEFVMLNGESELSDWQNCETLNRGYLFASEYEFSLNPGFEVCMRNKGYVLTTEYGPSSKQVLNAQTARLRGPVQFSQQGSTSYPGYFR